MTATGWDFVPEDRQLIDRTAGEALARMLRTRWPRDTAKQIAKAWGLDATTAANLVKGHCSERTLTKAIRAEGWALLAPLGEALTGESYEAHLNTIIEETENARRTAEVRRDRVRALEARAASLAGLGGGVAAPPGR
jgi:hypothetical protein